MAFKRERKKDMAELLTKEIFNKAIRDAGSICILGHISPDGDCIGSVLGVYNYIKNIPECRDKKVQPYLEEINHKFDYLKGACDIASCRDDLSYELAIVLDCAGIDRMGKYASYYETAAHTILVDHHHTNTGFCDYALICGEASSASEVVYALFDKAYVNAFVAECIYTGIIHDTGVFKHNSTHKSTMETAAECMEYGINFGRIIDDSFFSMTFEQKKMLGYILYNMQSRFDGRLVYGCVDMKTRRAMNAEKMDMDGMIDNMRTTTDALAAVYLYETLDGRVKASMRSNSDIIDVSRIASLFGGGGHKRAAGCFMSGDFEKDIDDICAEFGRQLKAAIT